MADYVPRKGELITLTFDPQSGHEQRGRRPALVVSNDLFNKHTGLCIACPIANTRREYPFHVAIQAGEGVTGVVMVEQVKSIDFRSRKARRRVTRSAQIAVCATFSLACAAPAQTAFEFERHVGIVVIRSPGSPCLVIPAQDLPDGARLTLADPTDSAAVIDAVVTRRQESCPGEEPDPRARFYSLRVTSHVVPQPGSVWFAIVGGRGLLRTSERGVRGDLDADGVEETLRVCTSMEGLHFTVWSGEPLVGTRRWHRYFPLGYDVEPSCTEQDY